MSPGCYAAITYCWRYEENDAQFDRRQYVIEKIQQVPPSCSGLDDATFIRQAIDKFYHDPTVFLWVNPCDPTYAVTQVVTAVTATCWMHPMPGLEDPFGGVYGDGTFAPCFNGTAWCKKIITVCEGDDTIEFISWTYESEGTGDCLPLSQSGGVWELNKCYDLDPCGNQ